MLRYVVKEHTSPIHFVSYGIVQCMMFETELRTVLREKKNTEKPATSWIINIDKINQIEFRRKS